MTLTKSFSAGDKAADPLYGLYKKINENSMRLLTELVKRQRLALCLGAGISIPAGLPSWADLLSKLLEGACVLERNRIIELNPSAPIPRTEDLLQAIDGKKLFQSVGVLESAEYIQLLLAEAANSDAIQNGFQLDTAQQERRSAVYMAASVRAALERHLQKKKEDPKFVKDVSVLEAISDLILCGKGVRQVITYNYDDLLEFYVSEHILKHFPGKDMKAMCVSHGLGQCVVQMNGQQRPTHIYHVHGMLPMFTGSKEEIQQEVEKGVILSERSYQDLEYNVYCTTNTCQGQLFQSCSCLFIGFSAQDYNYRRIVQRSPISKSDHAYITDCIKEGQFTEILKNKKLPPLHFIFYPINQLVDEVYKSNRIPSSITDYNQACEFILQNMTKMQSYYYQLHNVWPIYITYSEQAGYIAQLAEAAKS